MGVRIDLPIHDLEEANYLDKLLLRGAENAKARANARMSTADEIAEANQEHELALRLRQRMLGGS